MHQQLWTGVLARHGHSFSRDQYKAHYAGVLSSHHDVSRAAYVATDLADAVAWLFPDAVPVA